MVSEQWYEHNRKSISITNNVKSYRRFNETDQADSLTVFTIWNLNHTVQMVLVDPCATETFWILLTPCHWNDNASFRGCLNCTKRVCRIVDDWTRSMPFTFLRNGRRELTSFGDNCCKTISTQFCQCQHFGNIWPSKPSLSFAYLRRKPTKLRSCCIFMIPARSGYFSSSCKTDKKPLRQSRTEPCF